MNIDLIQTLFLYGSIIGLFIINFVIYKELSIITTYIGKFFDQENLLASFNTEFKTDVYVQIEKIKKMLNELKELKQENSKNKKTEE
jgi:hypothetical protein